MTDTQRALLKAILQNPAEDSVRLEYADALEEDGYDPRAEFIRVQVELARAEPLCVGVVRRGMEHPVHPFCQGCARARFLVGRERELIIWLNDNNLMRGAETWVRGFVQRWESPADYFLKHADALIWNEKMTDVCPECDGRGETRFCDAAGDMDDEPCLKCGGSLGGGYKRGKGRVPRPMPDTAQPIEKVTLTTDPDEHEEAFGPVKYYHADKRTVEYVKFPGVEFELPPPAPPVEVEPVGWGGSIDSYIEYVNHLRSEIARVFGVPADAVNGRD